MAFNELEPLYQRFIEAYVESPFRTNEEFAKDFECHRRTISDWIKKYQPEIEELSLEITNRIKSKLQKLTEKALLEADVLLCDTEDKRIRADMIKTILSNGLVKRTESAVEMTGKQVQITIEEAK